MQGAPVFIGVNTNPGGRNDLKELDVRIAPVPMAETFVSGRIFGLILARIVRLRTPPVPA